MSTRAAKAIIWAVGTVWLLVTLVFFEGSFGHDGLLCEWGYQLNSEDNGCK